MLFVMIYANPSSMWIHEKWNIIYLRLIRIIYVN